MSIAKALFARLESLYPELVQFRREMHMYPELSFQEVETPRKIAAALGQMGLEVRTGVGGRGVLGLLKGGQEGPTIAFRADFDALPIQDEKEVPYRSRVPGVMHACGHDIHTASLLGAARVLSEAREQLAGNLLFIHQFGEELVPGGALPMIEDGCLEGVDAIYGVHVSSGMPYGMIGVREGYTMAAADTFEIEIVGKGGHGAAPHLTVDPIVTGSQLVLNLQQIVSRRVRPQEAAVLTVGSFHSGETDNVIPETARLSGTVRSFDEETRTMIEQAVRQIVQSTCEGAGATWRLEYQRGYPALWNHPEETKRVERLARQVAGERQVRHLPAMMESEDFARYLQKVPGSFFYVGGGNPEIAAVFPHHHPHFDVDERSMLLIGKMFIALALDYLHPDGSF